MKTGLLRQPAWPQQWHTPLPQFKKKKKQQLQGSQPTQVQVFTGRVWSKEMNLSSNPYMTSERLGILPKQYSSHIAPLQRGIRQKAPNIVCRGDGT